MAESEFQNYKDAIASGDMAAAAAAVADSPEQVNAEPELSDSGENEIEKQLRERAEEERPKPEPDEEEERAEARAEEVKTEEKRERPKHDPRRRIEKLTRENYEKDAELAEWRSGKRKVEAAPKTEPAKNDRASTEQEIAQVSREERITKLRSFDKDYDKVIATLPQEIREIVKEGNPFIEHFLAKTPKALEELQALTPEAARVAVRELNEQWESEQARIEKGRAIPEVAKAHAIQSAAMELSSVLLTATK